MQQRSRRSFLQETAAWAAAGAWVARMPVVSGAAPRFDPSFGTASEALRALRAGVISSRELVEHTFNRIRQHNPRVNAFVTVLEEQAMERARQADEALARGKPWGPLHGLPIVIKDSFETEGVRTTVGSRMFENYVPPRDAPAVARLRRAGAILMGKTNLPEFASDLQCYNAVAGTTNNPWDLTRTPGGSSGGGAAALAAGFTFLELGSDIGGSIRTPCHFCGIYGHKPSLEVVPLQGHIPPLPGTPNPLTDLPVAGPMARSAQDLLLGLKVLGGPMRAEAIAYRWQLPSPRGARLKDYRIGYVLDDAFCPVPPEVKDVLGAAIEAIRKAGVEVSEGWPEGVDPQATFDAYLPLLAADMPATDEQLTLLQQGVNTPWGYYARQWIEGAGSSHKTWLMTSEARLQARRVWQRYFATHDAFIMPTNFVPAFPHDHELTFFERTVTTSQGKRLYGDMLRWICFATLSGCPATVAPAGRTREGLPVGMQIVGPYLEDATTIDIAGRLADVVGDFRPPPGFEI